MWLFYLFPLFCWPCFLIAAWVHLPSDDNKCWFPTSLWCFKNCCRWLALFAFGWLVSASESTFSSITYFCCCIWIPSPSSLTDNIFFFLGLVVALLFVVPFFIWFPYWYLLNYSKPDLQWWSHWNSKAIGPSRRLTGKWIKTSFMKLKSLINFGCKNKSHNSTQNFLLNVKLNSKAFSLIYLFWLLLLMWCSINFHLLNLNTWPLIMSSRQWKHKLLQEGDHIFHIKRCRNIAMLNVQ